MGASSVLPSVASLTVIVSVVKCTGLYKLPKHNFITFAGMAVRPQVMPDLLPQQSSGGSPVTGMTRLNSTEDAKQKPFMSFGFSAEAGGAKPVIGAGGAGDPSRRESTHVPSVNVAPTPAVHDMTSDTPEIRKYKKRFNSEILCAALWGVNLLIGNYFYIS